MATDEGARRDELMRMTMRELRQLARDEGICLGYAGARKDTAVDEIVVWERCHDVCGHGRGGE